MLPLSWPDAPLSLVSMSESDDVAADLLSLDRSGSSHGKRGIAVETMEMPLIQLKKVSLCVVGTGRQSGCLTIVCTPPLTHPLDSLTLAKPTSLPKIKAATTGAKTRTL